jgi:TonB family protein
MNPEMFLNRQIREYLITELLGVGGMGAVFKGYHVRLKTQRAIKILQPTLSKDMQFKARFEKEARILAQLENPYLIRVYEFFEEENHLFLVMEYVFGESLADRLKYMGSIPAQEAAEIIGLVCEGLAHAHAQGIIHRDLSPDNILITARPEGGESIKIIDFGIAKTIFSDDSFSSLAPDGLTTPGIFIGKVKYCSPEQASGKDLDHHSDQYSAALIFYESVTGKSAFEGETLMESLTLRLHEPPPRLNQTCSEKHFSPALDEVLTRAMDLHPENRFKNMLAFRDALFTSIRMEREEKQKAAKSVPVQAEPVDADESTEIKAPETPKAERGRMKGLTNIAEDLEDTSQQNAPSYIPERPSKPHSEQFDLHELANLRKRNKHRFTIKLFSIFCFCTALALIGIYREVISEVLGLQNIFSSSQNQRSKTGEKKVKPDSPEKSTKHAPASVPVSTLPNLPVSSAPAPTPANIGNGPFLANSPGVSQPQIVQSVEPDPRDVPRDVKLPVTVVVEVIILKDGKISKTEVLRPVHPALDQVALDVIKKWKFKGGSKYGQPADIILDVPVEFTKRR